MSTATLPHPAVAPRGPSKLFRAIGLVFDGVVEARSIANRYERLSRMSNVELARLGLTRHDIPSAAVNGVAGL